MKCLLNMLDFQEKCLLSTKPPYAQDVTTTTEDYLSISQLHGEHLGSKLICRCNEPCWGFIRHGFCKDGEDCRYCHKESHRQTRRKKSKRKSIIETVEDGLNNEGLSHSTVLPDKRNGSDTFGSSYPNDKSKGTSWYKTTADEHKLEATNDWLHDPEVYPTTSAEYPEGQNQAQDEERGRTTVFLTAAQRRIRNEDKRAALKRAKHYTALLEGYRPQRGKKMTTKQATAQRSGYEYDNPYGWEGFIHLVAHICMPWYVTGKCEKNRQCMFRHGTNDPRENEYPAHLRYIADARDVAGVQRSYQLQYKSEFEMRMRGLVLPATHNTDVDSREEDIQQRVDTTGRAAEHDNISAAQRIVGVSWEVCRCIWACKYYIRRMDCPNGGTCKFCHHESHRLAYKELGEVTLNNKTRPIVSRGKSGARRRNNQLGTTPITILQRPTGTCSSS